MTEAPPMKLAVVASTQRLDMLIRHCVLGGVRYSRMYNQPLRECNWVEYIPEPEVYVWP